MLRLQTIITTVFLMLPLIAAADDLSITAEQWELARSAERIIAMPEIRAVVRRWDDTPGRVIEIQYPGGEEGEIWVNELRAWLVSLGVPSRFHVAVPGSGKDDLIRFRIINQGEQF